MNLNSICTNKIISAPIVKLDVLRNQSINVKFRTNQSVPKPDRLIFNYNFK